MSLTVRERFYGDHARPAPTLPSPALSGGILDSQPAALHVRLRHIIRLRTTHTTQHEHRNYASGQGGQGAQSKRTHAGCMGARKCAGWRAVHARKGGLWLTCVRWRLVSALVRCHSSAGHVEPACQHIAHALRKTCIHAYNLKLRPYMRAHAMLSAVVCALALCEFACDAA